ncbi:ExbD/TolR family protein [Cerasicoccus arenae]|uniref:Transporter ExbD n=1 Tax=Cerasicoccus arenae TaxID=424488 RepID=A0A8J3GDN2_9BACT|nr:biopolymer transporter ExbD [Cerasicoccus arenae]MBK1858005.1 biopolymer transporter ExbD [Cerasicoccus arenae]GHB97517.1 transporter ExbD [Cerasicoccus arenae]
MARTFRRKRSMEAVSEINVTPLIDLAFALLIIFMITTPLLEQTIPLNLPKEEQRDQPSRSDMEIQVISIDEGGQVYWGKEPISLVKLDDMLNGLSTRPEPPVLSIRGDAAIQYQKIIDVLNLVKKHKLSRISLDTQVR